MIIRSFASVITAISMLITGESIASGIIQTSDLSVKLSGNALTVEYSISELKEKYSSKTIKTQTPWSNGEQVIYRGISLSDLLNESPSLDHVKEIEGSAVNGYSTILSIKDIVAFNPLLALQRKCSKADMLKMKCDEGAYIPLATEDFGPIFLVWPYDSMPGSADPCDNSKWIWFFTGIRAID